MLSAKDPIAVGERAEWSDGEGTIVIERLAPRLALFRVSGFFSDELGYFGCSRNGAMIDQLVARGEAPAFQGFHDWSEMLGYTQGARKQSTSFMMARRKQFAQVCVLFRSPMVAMGINVANIVLGGFIKATSSRAEFDERLRQAVRAAGAASAPTANAPGG